RQRLDPVSPISENSASSIRSQTILDQQQLPALEIALDLELARRLERAESLAGAAWVQTRARVEPEVGATWTEVAGAYALFDGVDSPLTQTFGLGLFEPVGAVELEQLEAFYQQRGAAIAHNVS